LTAPGVSGKKLNFFIVIRLCDIIIKKSTYNFNRGRIQKDLRSCQTARSFCIRKKGVLIMEEEEKEIFCPECGGIIDSIVIPKEKLIEFWVRSCEFSGGNNSQETIEKKEIVTSILLDHVEKMLEKK
jgi:hypothetical protein